MNIRKLHAVSAALALLTIPCAANAADIDTLQARLVEDLLTTSSANAENLLNTQLSDGSWSDINYQDHSNATWSPASHLSRLKVLAIAWSKPTDPYYQSADVLTAINLGLDYWYAQAPTSDNWWFNDIGKQLQLGPIGILLEDALSDTRRTAIANDLASTPDLTGQNRVWISQEIIQRGCIEDNPSLVTTGFSGITDTVVVSTEEGVQPDWSFHQHGAQLYNAGYGAGFLVDTVYWAWMARDTSFGFSSDQIATLRGLLLDGDRWMIRGNFFDYSADGREITRPNQNCSFVPEACERMADLDPANATTYTAFANYVGGTGTPVVTGNRHFWRSDFMSHQQPDLYFSVKMCSARTIGTEVVNRENLLGNWLPFGLTFWAPTGTEYVDIFPVWDWTLLPGVTAPRFATEPSGNHVSTFVGGVSNATSGVAAFDLNHESTTAHKTWFALGNWVVALGTGITSSRTESVATTLDQSLLRGQVTSSSGAVSGESTVDNAAWLHHGGLGFVMLTPASVHLRTGAASGSWRTINASQSADTVTKDVFLAWLDHGTTPQNAEYAYAVLPAATAQEVQAAASDPDVSVIQQSHALTAVRHRGLAVTGAVFFSAGSLDLGTYRLAVDQPCLILAEEATGHVSVANPEAGTSSVMVTITPTEQQAQSHTVSLPQTEELLGSTVGVDFDLHVAAVDAGAADAPSHDARLPDSAADATASSDAGAGSAASPDDDSGCGCRLTPSVPSSSFAWVMGLWLVGWKVLRRRRSPCR